MILRNIDGEEIQEVDFHGFVDFFTEHLFFKFMEGGRATLLSGYKDLVDTSFYRAEQIYFSNHRKEKVYGSPLEKLKLYDAVYNDGMQRVVNGFIKSGTDGMRTAIFQVASDPRLFQ
jgi:hypothetical protein